MSPHPQQEEEQDDFSFKKFFIPLTTFKAIHIIAIVGFIVYFNSLFNGFVWDDDFQIVKNIHVHNGDFFYYFTHTIGPYYRPLMFFFYTLFFQLFSLSSLFYHLFQILIHIANTVLIFFLFFHFSRKSSLSLILALIFLTHPINTESTNYIANLQDVLFTFFGLTALTNIIKQPFGRYTNIISALLLLLSLLSKETGILFVIICGIYILFFQKRNRILKISLCLGSFFAYFMIRVALVGPIDTNAVNVTPQNTIISATITEKILTTPKIIFYYLSSLALPRDLGGQYWYVKTPSFANFYIPLLFDMLFILVLLAIYIFLRKNYKKLILDYIFFLLWFCLGIFILLPILPLDKTASIRWFYFPFIGLLGIIAIVSKMVKVSSAKIKSSLIFLIIIIILIIFSIRTMVRNTNWYNGITLFSHDIVTRENVGDIQYNYGSYLLQAKNYDKSSYHLQQAVELVPSYYPAWYNLGIAYLNMDKLEYAKMSFKKAISIKKNSILSYRLLIYVLLLQNDAHQAKQYAQIALKMWQDNPIFWRLLGLAEYKLGNNESAANAFEKSLHLLHDPITIYYQQQLKKNLPIEIKE